MGLRKKLDRLAQSVDLFERKERFLTAVTLELGQLLLQTRCAAQGALVDACECPQCTHVRQRVGVFTAGMRALQDETAALVARLAGGAPTSSASH